MGNQGSRPPSLLLTKPNLATKAIVTLAAVALIYALIIQ